MVEALDGYHAFGPTVVRGTTAADTFKIALYSSSASLSSATATYTVSGEIVGSGYTAAGQILVINTAPTAANGVAYLGFANPVWANASFTARGALIYNATQGNRSVAVLDFGGDKTSVSPQSFTIQMPVADYQNAIVRIA
jgi:hypothetical protein